MWHRTEGRLFVSGGLVVIVVLAAISVWAWMSSTNERISTLGAILTFSFVLSAILWVLVSLVTPTAVRFDAERVAVRFPTRKVIEVPWDQVAVCKYNPDGRGLSLAFSGRPFPWRVVLSREVGEPLADAFAAAGASRKRPTP